jgi:GntR family transcriptional repressor for pyruvate dehydrogenase complex
MIDLIVSGKFSCGEHLPSEKELCEMFQVGRNTLREAVRALNILGFIDVRVPEGMFVAQSPDNFYTKKMQLASKYGYDNVEELTEARISIECAIVKLAAKKAGEQDKEKLRAIYLKMKNTSDDRARLAADAQFHMMVAEIAKNGFLKQTLLLLLDGMNEWMARVEVGAPSANQISTPQHEEILNAICQNDVELAAQKMNEHLSYVGGLYLDIERGS